MKSIFIVLLAALLCGNSAFAQGNIPQKAKDAFATAHKGITKVKWEKEGANYEASFQDQKTKMSVVYTADGTVVETETAIPLSELPEQARRYVAAKGKIKETAKIVKADGTVVYEAEVGGKDYLFTPKGDFIESKKD